MSVCPIYLCFLWHVESLGAEFPAFSSADNEDDDGLRFRHVQPTIVLKRSSDEEEEEGEEEEFNLPARKEEKRGFSLNQLIVGALVLLCVGSFFFSGEFWFWSQI